MHKGGSLIFGFILVGMGAIFLLDNLGYVDSEYVFENFWPLILVLIGISMLFRRSRASVVSQSIPSQDKDAKPGTGEPFPDSSSDFLIRSTIFGDVEAKVTSKNFSGGSCSVIFGSIDIDLTQAELKPGQSTLRLNGIFGRIKVKVSAGVELAVNANLVAGEVTVRDQRRAGLFESMIYESSGFRASDRKLMIQASQVFGDVKVF